MAPKKKDQTQKMSLGAFLQDDNYGGSWADEVEETVGSQPLPAATHERRTGGYSSYGGFAERSYPSRDSFPQELPTRPPFTAHLGNLSYDATTETVTEFFEGCDVISIRIIEDKIEQRPKGFAYAEFRDLEGLKKALELDGQSFQGRGIRVKIADPPKDRDRGDRDGSARDLSSWERKGPLPDMPNRSDRRDFSDRRGPPRDGPADDGKSRDFSTWERRGPLSPLPQTDRPGSRDSSRPRPNDGKRSESFRPDRRTSPATWGEGRQEGSRPPRSEFHERPERPERPERTPTAADLDNQWRSNMKPDRVTPEQSRPGSEAPPSPAGPAAALPVGRPKLNLQKRTVSEAPGSPPPSVAGDSKANPFGAARPIDTAAKEREIAEKKEEEAKKKKEADEKAKEERRLAKEAAVKEAEEAAAKAEADKENEAAEAAAAAEQSTEADDAPKSGEQAASGDQKIPTKPRELQNPKNSRANDSGNWRTTSGEARTARGGYQSAPRGGRGDSRGGRGRGGRGGAFEGARSPRANGGAPPASQQQPATPVEPGSPTVEQTSTDPDGWTTVAPTKGRRNQGTRA